VSWVGMAAIKNGTHGQRTRSLPHTTDTFSPTPQRFARGMARRAPHLGARDDCHVERDPVEVEDRREQVTRDHTRAQRRAGGPECAAAGLEDAKGACRDGTDAQTEGRRGMGWQRRREAVSAEGS
jgi:hypothetical protein